jgi:hypothetical protein
MILNPWVCDREGAYEKAREMIKGGREVMDQGMLSRKAGTQEGGLSLGGVFQARQVATQRDASSGSGGPSAWMGQGGASWGGNGRAGPGVQISDQDHRAAAAGGLADLGMHFGSAHGSGTVRMDEYFLCVTNQ